jgi:hypothetical protein
VLDQQVRRANLAVGNTWDRTGTRARAVVSGHVVLQLLRVGALRGFPAGDLVGRVEVVREVLGVGVAHLPVGRETGISLLRERQRKELDSEF